MPEIQLWLADEATALWQASQDLLDDADLPPPFWAFAWPGGQAMARYVLDHPEVVAGKRTLDYGAGGGIVAIAARLAGAATVCAVDLDPFAAAAAGLNAAANGCVIRTETGDGAALSPAEFDVILAADVCYDREQSAKTQAWLAGAASAGVETLLGDPRRAYLAADGFERLAAYDVPTSLALERAALLPTEIWRVASTGTTTIPA